MKLLDLLNWLGVAGGLVSSVLVVIGFMFREKWKQVLQRSLSSDLERLKSELAQANAVHAASLTPQLETVKHEFQAKLEAYKVSLIAESEAAKARAELRKTIALRYAETEFERLVNLELVIAPLGTDMLARGMADPDSKTLDASGEMVAATRALTRATEEAAMFLPPSTNRAILDFRGNLIAYWQAHLGPGRPRSASGEPLHDAVFRSAAVAHEVLVARIRELGVPSASG